MSRIVILNGGPSAGKTAIATAFRDQRAAEGEFWYLIGIDDVLAKVPESWKSAGGKGGAFTDIGFRFETTSEGPRVLVGTVGRALLRTYQATVAAAARAGLKVIVDEVLIDRASWDDWQQTLEGLDVTWVGIHCSPEVAEERNRHRGVRFPGLAEGLALTVHEYPQYDLEIDTTAKSPSDGLRELLDVLVR